MEKEQREPLVAGRLKMLIQRIESMALVAFVFIAIWAIAPAACRSSGPDDVASVLQRQTQELLDSIAAGDQAPWSRYLHEDVIYAAEDGSTRTKKELIDQLKPFPAEVWGKLHITKFRAALHDRTAITSYVVEEDQGYFGQVLDSRYLVTDTWVETADGWRLAASQVLALREDPPAAALTPAQLEEYIGVYALTQEITYTISRGQDGLVGQRNGRDAEPLKPELADYFFIPGQPRMRKVFQRDAAGRITAFADRRESWDIIWRRVR